MELKQRVRIRRSKFTPASTSSILDDMCVVLEYADIAWFLHRFKQLGKPLNMHLNTDKTKLLTSLTTRSPLTSFGIPNSDKQHLQNALQCLSNSSEVMQGVRLLDNP